jgi:hypothetical protein
MMGAGADILEKKKLDEKASRHRFPFLYEAKIFDLRQRRYYENSTRRI